MSDNITPGERATYVRYSESVEVEQPNEAEDARESVAAFMRMCQFTFEKHRHGVRGAHAKSHGILKGELRVYDNLPEELRQGLFRTPRAYPAIVRYSTADVLRHAWDGVVRSFEGVALGGRAGGLLLLVGFGFTWTFFQHFCSGLRHLVMDTGAAMEPALSRRIAAGTIVVSTALTLIVWAYILSMKGTI